MITVTARATDRCNLACYYCVSGCNKKQNCMPDEIDFDAMIRWMQKYTPGCALHISGGEPLLVDDIHIKTQACVDAGFDVTIFTNTTLLPEMPEMWHLPVKWHLTHHPDSGVDIRDFRIAVNCVRHSPHICTRVVNGINATRDFEIRDQLYKDLNVHWMNPQGTYRFIETVPQTDCPNDELLMIECNGNVHNCSKSKYGTLGNIYDMTFDSDAASQFRCPAKKYNHSCQAQQSAQVLAKLK